MSIRTPSLSIIFPYSGSTSSSRNATQNRWWCLIPPSLTDMSPSSMSILRSTSKRSLTFFNEAGLPVSQYHAESGHDRIHIWIGFGCLMNTSFLVEVDIQEVIVIGSGDLSDYGCPLHWCLPSIDGRSRPFHSTGGSYTSLLSMVGRRISNISSYPIQKIRS